MVLGYMFRPHYGHLQDNYVQIKCPQCAYSMGFHNVYNNVYNAVETCSQEPLSCST